jgi:hypothetical protein
MTVFEIPKRLQSDFARWIDRFEQDALDNPNFPWASFHQEGLLLSRRLKEELGNAANVVYVKPFEDPKRGYGFAYLFDRACVMFLDRWKMITRVGTQLWKR